jgi:hypothetical protein
MSAYSKEYSEMKGRAKIKLQDLIAGIKNGTIQMSGNEPKMSIRALRTLLLSEDKVHGELVEKFLSGKLTTEQFKNKLRSASETRVPKPLRRLPTDRIHHLTPLEISGIVEDMPDNELLNLLQDYEKDNIYFGDSDPNVRGGSFDERAHTGARPKASKSKIIYPNQLGEEGLREMSAHPRGTRDKMFNIPDRPTTAAEARGVIDPLLEQGQEDIQRGIIADTPRRNYINSELVRQGVIEQGTDIFSANIDDATLKRAKPFLQSAVLQEGAAKAFKTPSLETGRGSIRFNAGKLAVGGSIAFGLNAAATSAQAGDFGGAANELIGSVVGEIPLVGDAIVTEFENPRAVGEGTDHLGMTGQEYTQRMIEENKKPHVPWEERLGNTISNQAEWAKNNPVEALKNVVGGGISSSISSLVDNPMLAQFTAPYHAIKNIKGSIRVSNEEEEEESPISVGFAEGGF